MTFNVSCYWADLCASAEEVVVASSIEELLEAMEDFFEEACGITAVDGFSIECVEREDLYPYEWDNENLKRNRNLSDVWNKERKNIKEYFGKVFDI
jgi:hypothetical protein